MNCKRCKRCCHNTNNKDFIIELTDKERKNLNRTYILMQPNKKCPYLTSNGCKLTKNKPIVCKIFPLIYRNGNIYQDQNCPMIKNTKLIKECVKELNNLLSLTKKERDRISTMWQ